MELIILDKDFIKTGVIDAFESLIWTDRYYECGDFELVTAPNSSNVGVLIGGHYAITKDSDHFMLIEDVHIVTDPVNGSKLTVKGRSGEVILDRRIVWNKIDLNEETMPDAVMYLFNDNIMDPMLVPRHISNLQLEMSEDPLITNVLVSGQYWGDLLYDVLVDLCYKSGVGFRLTLTEANNFLVQLYAGVDRSYDQLENPYVVFSPDFENLKNSTYMSSTRLSKSAALTAGEKGIENTQTSLEVDPSNGATTGIERREMFIDAQDVKKVDEEGEPISDELYLAHLRQRGEEELAKCMSFATFSSEVDPFNNFIYGVDFFLGDVLQIRNEYGYEGKSRVVEVTRCVDQTGLKIYPIFSAI